MTEQSFESQQTSFSAEDLKAAWDTENVENASTEEEKPQVEEPANESSTDEVAQESNSEGNESETSGEPAQAKATDAEPIILRKQNKRMREKIRRLEEEMLSIRSDRPTIPQMSQSTGLVDPITGQPLDENSVEGQVFKAFGKLQLAEQKKQADRQEFLRQQKIAQSMHSLNEQLDEASEKYADFDEVVRGDDVPFTEVMRSAGTLIPNPAETYYAMAKNKTELAELAKAPPEEQVRAMVKLSAHLLAKGSAVQKSTPKKIAPLKNNPVNRQSSGVINDKSSVSDIRERIKNGWKK